MKNETASKAVVPAPGAELPPGFFELADDIKSIVRGAQVRAQLKIGQQPVGQSPPYARTHDD